MIKENWMFWIVLLLFIGSVMRMFLYASGYKTEATWDADLSYRLVGIIISITSGVLYAIALGWL